MIFDLTIELLFIPLNAFGNIRLRRIPLKIGLQYSSHIRSYTSGYIPPLVVVIIFIFIRYSNESDV